MFWYRGHLNEKIIRNSTGQLARFGQALDKYLPVYWERIRNIESVWTAHKTPNNIYHQTKLMRHCMWRTIEAPKCTDLFMTANWWHPYMSPLMNCKHFVFFEATFKIAYRKIWMYICIPPTWEGLIMQKRCFICAQKINAVSGWVRKFLKNDAF